MIKKIIILFAIILVAGVNNIKAQGCSAPTSDEGLNFFGFLQVQNETLFDTKTKNSFTFERARIGVTGKIPYDFTYYVVLELSPFIAPNPYLLDAFITYDRYKWAKATIGSFKTPIGLETSMACNDLPTVYRSTVTLQTVAPFRDIGFLMMGGDESTFMTYQFGVMNGSGLGRGDNNNSKDYVGRVVFKPTEYLKIGGSFRYAKPSYNNDVDERTTFAGELQLKLQNFSLLGEYIMDNGDYNRDLGGGCSGNLIELGDKRSGGYFIAGYMTPWNLQPVFKYDFFDSGNATAYKETNMTFGLNYFFNDWTRLQVNYIYKAESPVENMNDELVIQLQVKF